MEETAINIWGTACKAIKKDGKTFVQPWFHGQVLGNVVDAFETEDGKGFHILLLTQEDSRMGVWITATNKELDHMEIEEPILGERLYFCVIQKTWHKPHTRPYHIIEGWPDDTWMDEEICPTG